jgi:hypothetical protein
MKNLLHPPAGRTAATKAAAAAATPDQIAYTLRSLAAETKKYGRTHVPAWLFHRCGLGDVETILGTYHVGMFGRSMSKFKVKLCK